LSNSTELDAIIQEVKHEFRLMLIKRRELIQRLGNAFEKVVSDPESICEEIKNCLKDEIADKIISARDIERYCPEKWKKKTKLVKKENDNLSFSNITEEKKNEKEILLDTQGNSVNSSPILDLDSIAVISNDNYLESSDRQREKESACANCIQLINEIQRIRNEKDKMTKNLEDAFQIIKAQKEKELELQKQIENNTNNQFRSSSDTCFDIEFPISYRPLQQEMTRIFKLPVRQEVWFAVRIDGKKKKVVSAEIGRKLQDKEDLQLQHDKH
jgi:hypothetical protein